MHYRRLMPLAALLAAAPTAALAQDGAAEVTDTGDTGWLLAATLLLLLVIPGLALFNSGRARSGALVSGMVQTASVAAAVSLAWIVVGYTLAFGDVSGGWLGTGNAWMLITLGNVRDGLTVPESGFALFQIACALIAASLMTGAWAGRGRFGWVVLFSTLWSLVVLAPIVHWLWGGGWLAASVGAIDFAGGLAIEAAAGTSALVAALLIGRGLDFDAKARPAAFAPFTLAGAFLLWVGWLALCGGSAFSANDDAASALLAGHAAACAGLLVRLGTARLRRRPVTAEAVATGLVSGLAAIAPAALYVSPGSAICFGALGSLASYGAAALIRRAGIDDRLDVFALFAVPGIVGALLLAPFMAQTLGGAGYDAGMNPLAQLVAQAIAVMAVVVWSVIGTAIVALMCSLAFPMRVSEQAEAAGLDATSHGEA